jgi:predicted ABC-type ATPase
VPDHKIIERYKRNLALIRQAADIATVTMVFDNSKRGQPPQWLLTLRYGLVTEQTDEFIPSWAEKLYL